MEFLDREIRFLKGVGEKRAQQLNKLGVYTIYDLFYFFPKKYVDFSSPCEIAFAPYDDASVVKATVLSKNNGVRINGGKTLFKVICADETSKLNLTFFNAEYTVKRLDVGKEYLFYGKFSGSMLCREISSPSFILAQGAVKLQPVYPLTAGLSSNILAKYIACALRDLELFFDFMPQDILEQYNLPSLDFALRHIHIATDNTSLETAKRRLIFDEFFILQLGIALMGESESKRTTVIAKKQDLSHMLKLLPFAPTGAQLRSIKDILADFKTGTAMNRLLQGDVGSGKTLVAAAASFVMSTNNYQSCMLAPTEILAFQHYNSLCEMFRGLNVNVALLTASAKAKERKELLSRLASGDIDILVGTHSVLNDAVIFKNLGLCITDEQHRFGVAQRTRISQKGDNPHVLVMSATPIPRTLAMIIYGNMQISVLDEMPVGRKPVESFFVGTDKRARMFGFIDKHVKLGKQAFIVLPAIEDCENMTELQSVTGYYNDAIKPLLPHIRTEILHGRMKAKEKQEIMERFKNGSIDLLCSTTVVEVGVDVPNAVLMIIENAERYGLSALHQLRGRVGRGSAQSYCIFVSDNKGKNVTERLKFLCSTQDGFAVSQYDLDHRGPGDFFGARQHGLPNLKIAQLSEDLTVLQQSQAAAEKLLKEDSQLEHHPHLKKRLEKLFEGFVL